MAYHFNNRIKIVKEISTGPYPDDKEEKVISSPWADIKTMKGSEYLLNNVTASEEPTRFIIRYRQGIDTTQRIKWGNKDYNIHSVTNDDGRNQTLTIFAKAHP
ncbi:phage head-tail adapter protein [Staphylococcus nepalensis]|nr:phage head-tail adapter protein [Staphylococcus nepalensis]